MTEITKVAKIDLSKEKYELKKYAQFGLIDFSSHALQRLRERNITPFDVFEALTQRNATIVQYKKEGSYHNKHPRFVVCAKSHKKVFHIVIEKQTINTTHHYDVITVYEPSSDFFSHNGKVLKKAKDRKQNSYSKTKKAHLN